MNAEPIKPGQIRFTLTSAFFPSCPFAATDRGLLCSVSPPSPLSGTGGHRGSFCDSKPQRSSANPAVVPARGPRAPPAPASPTLGPLPPVTQTDGRAVPQGEDAESAPRSSGSSQMRLFFRPCFKSARRSEPVRESYVFP